ncbi:hypothetical protein J1614_000621 [Plenodomus biglobosus]|nr:hypothetical protein J1614_000621 [Plenodomus biglobosus]
MLELCGELTHVSKKTYTDESPTACDADMQCRNSDDQWRETDETRRVAQVALQKGMEGNSDDGVLKYVYNTAPIMCSQ